jgi:hypothetical protein
MKRQKVRFLPAESLKHRFDVFGHFYSVIVAPKRVIECRSVLEIVHSESAPLLAASLAHRTPDAVLIMMNPGSSRPMTAIDNRIQRRAMHRLPVSLVPAKPDTTQYQIMRLMHFCEWKHVRILNLSDLRCSRSNEFFRQFRELETETAYEEHSIFAPQRQEELAQKLVGNVPVIRAWGVSPHLNPLIDRSLRGRPETTADKGLLKAGTTNKFLHPLPSLQSQKRAWLNRMVEQCRG